MAKAEQLTEKLLHPLSHFLQVRIKSLERLRSATFYIMPDMALRERLLRALSETATSVHLMLGLLTPYFGVRLLIINQLYLDMAILADLH